MVTPPHKQAPLRTMIIALEYEVVRGVRNAGDCVLEEGHRGSLIRNRRRSLEPRGHAHE